MPNQSKIDLQDLERRADALALALGHAVSRWAEVEIAIAEIFAASAKVDRAVAASILLNVKTFSLSLDMCNSAVQGRLAGTKELEFWNSVVEYTRELSGDRNYMAHNAVVVDAMSSGLPGIPKIGPNLLAHLAGADLQHAYSDKKKRPLDEVEIRELLADFLHLRDILTDFKKALTSETTSQQKYLGKVARRRPPRNERLAGAGPKSKTQPPSSP